MILPSLRPLLASGGAHPRIHCSVLNSPTLAASKEDVDDGPAPTASRATTARMSSPWRKAYLQNLPARLPCSSCLFAVHAQCISSIGTKGISMVGNGCTWAVSYVVSAPVWLSEEDISYYVVDIEKTWFVGIVVTTVYIAGDLNERFLPEQANCYSTLLVNGHA